MRGPAMIDANVLVYADDAQEPTKAARAAVVIANLVETARAVVTPQVLGEYWVAVTRGFSPAMAPERAEARIHEYRNFMRVFPYDSVVVAEAVRGARRYGFHYYDAQVWAAARLAAVDVVLSEDFDSGAEIEGVRFVNPFAEAFDVSDFLSG